MTDAASLLVALWPLLSAGPSPATGSVDSSRFEAAVDSFFARYFEFHPTIAAGAGLHEYDPLLGARGRDAINAYVADLRSMERRFEQMDVADLAPHKALDRQLILREIRGELFWLDEVGTWRKDPRFYSDQFDMTLLLMLDYAPLEERMHAVVSRLERFPELVEAARANVEDPPRPFVETALVAYEGWPAFLEGQLTEALAPVENPELQARFRAARDRAAEAIRAYADHLEQEVLPRADGEFALGAERYRRMNALLAGVDLPVERLEAIGRAELERLQVLADSLAEKIAPGRGVEGAFDTLGKDQPAPDAIVETAGEVIESLKAFVEREGLGTVLPGKVEVREIPPYARTNFAYIWIPGPFEDRANTGFYFIQPVEERWSERVREDFLESNNRWTILNTSAHEAYPGHYHHFGHLNRASTRAQQLLTAYVTAEGWAHYTEEMMWRHGLRDADPRLGLAVVRDALLRAVRYVVSIGLHTGDMTVEDAERMFRTVAYQDSVNAHQQALRGTYDPEYLNYTLGKLMIRRLLTDARAQAEAGGEPFDLGAFHDAFMAQGAGPVPWIARRILGDPAWVPFGEDGAGEAGGAGRVDANAGEPGAREPHAQNGAKAADAGEPHAQNSANGTDGGGPGRHGTAATVER